LKTEHAALQLTQRAWLLHWALFVCFAQPDGAARFLELALSETLLNVVQTAAPHLLWHIAVAHVAAPAPQRRLPARELARVLEQEASAHSDPATRFLLALHVECDFEAALAHLAEAEKRVKEDYFLARLAPQFAENARAMVFRAYCRIHQSIDLPLLQGKLGAASLAEAESYIVNLIRNEQDAKIDSASNQIVFSPAASSTAVYQKIVEKTQALATQTALLQAQLSRHNKR
jgi:translation initiation factor 3 subunit E